MNFADPSGYAKASSPGGGSSSGGGPSGQGSGAPTGNVLSDREAAAFGRDARAGLPLYSTANSGMYTKTTVTKNADGSYTVTKNILVPVPDNYNYKNNPTAKAKTVTYNEKQYFQIPMSEKKVPAGSAEAASLKVGTTYSSPVESDFLVKYDKFWTENDIFDFNYWWQVPGFLIIASEVLKSEARSLGGEIDLVLNVLAKTKVDVRNNKLDLVLLLSTPQTRDFADMLNRITTVLNKYGVEYSTDRTSLSTKEIGILLGHIMNFTESEFHKWSERGGGLIMAGVGLIGGAAAINAAAGEYSKPASGKNQTNTDTSSPHTKDHKPPGWTDEWRLEYGTRQNSTERHWFDPKGGEWRWHAPDKYHDTGHWDYNPWSSPSSPWENKYL